MLAKKKKKKKKKKRKLRYACHAYAYGAYACISRVPNLSTCGARVRTFARVRACALRPVLTLTQSLI